MVLAVLTGRQLDRALVLLGLALCLLSASVSLAFMVPCILYICEFFLLHYLPFGELSLVGGP